MFVPTLRTWVCHLHDGQQRSLDVEAHSTLEFHQRARTHKCCPQVEHVGQTFVWGKKNPAVLHLRTFHASLQLSEPLKLSVPFLRLRNWEVRLLQLTFMEIPAFYRWRHRCMCHQQLLTNSCTYTHTTHTHTFSLNPSGFNDSPVEKWVRVEIVRGVHSWYTGYTATVASVLWTTKMK